MPEKIQPNASRAKRQAPTREGSAWEDKELKLISSKTFNLLRNALNEKTISGRIKARTFAGYWWFVSRLAAWRSRKRTAGGQKKSLGCTVGSFHSPCTRRLLRRNDRCRGRRAGAGRSLLTHARNYFSLKFGSDQITSRRMAHTRAGWPFRRDRTAFGVLKLVTGLEEGPRR